MTKQYRAEFRIKDDRASDMTPDEHVEVTMVDSNHGIKSAVYIQRRQGLLRSLPRPDQLLKGL